MENIFNFDYEVQTLNNKDQSPSRFSVAYGAEGRIINCKKDSYKIVRTEDVNIVAQEFINRGYNVSPYIHKYGEKIGLSIDIGVKPSKVGESSYSFNLAIPNDGTGMGYLKLFQKRLICSNGMTRNINEEQMKYIRVPHTWDYKTALNLVTDVINANVEIITAAIGADEQLNTELIDNHAFTLRLNQWFFDREMPPAHKKDMSFNDFRKALYEDPSSIKCIDRYNQLMRARDAELEYNAELGLKLSSYTVMAVVNNYLSRRIEKSASIAPVEIQYERAQSKLVLV